MLTNAIYFKAGWQSTFPKGGTRKADFQVAKGKKVPVMMMNQTASFPHFRGKGFQALELPYRDGELSMVILLPDAVDGLPVIDAQGRLRTLPSHLGAEGGMDGFFAARFRRL